MKNWVKFAVVYYFPVIVWMMVIFWLSNRPKIVKLENPTSDFFIGKSAHLFEYALLCILWFRAINIHSVLKGKNWVIPLFLTGLYAISDEIHQLFIPGRTGMARDVLIDVLGGAIGLWILRNIYPKIRLILKK
jgi:VanZ family protein